MKVKILEVRRGGVAQTYVGPTNFLKADLTEDVAHLVLSSRQHFVLWFSLLDIDSKTPIK